MGFRIHINTSIKMFFKRRFKGLCKASSHDIKFPKCFRNRKNRYWRRQDLLQHFSPTTGSSSSTHLHITLVKAQFATELYNTSVLYLLGIYPAVHVFCLNPLYTPWSERMESVQVQNLLALCSETGWPLPPIALLSHSLRQNPQRNISLQIFQADAVPYQKHSVRAVGIPILTRWSFLSSLSFKVQG